MRFIYEKVQKTAKLIFYTAWELSNAEKRPKVDKENDFNNGVFGKVIGVIDTSNILSNKPVFDIICVNEVTYEFYIEVIK